MAAAASHRFKMPGLTAERSPLSLSACGRRAAVVLERGVGLMGSLVGSTEAKLAGALAVKIQLPQRFLPRQLLCNRGRKRSY